MSAGDFLSGIDPVSAFGADVEAETAVEFDRRFLGDLKGWKPTGLLNIPGIELQRDTVRAGDIFSFEVSGSFEFEWASEADAAAFFGMFGPPVRVAPDMRWRARLLRWLSRPLWRL